MNSTIPCKRPKVVVAPRSAAETNGAHDATCHVPRCGWTYPADKQFMALKSDANDHATRHRQEHRAAVPYVETTDLGIYHLVTCVCGHQHRVHGTKADAAAHVEHHLSANHGLVTC